MHLLELIVGIYYFFSDHWSFFCWFWYAGLLTLAFLYAYWGVWYAKGMAEYAYYNNVTATEENRYTEPESCWESVSNESKELFEAVREMSFWDIVLEASDVGHALLKWLIVSWLPKGFYTRMWIWLLVFPLLPFCTMKLGSRYRRNGCIRNHKNPDNCGHACNHKDVKVKKTA